MMKIRIFGVLFLISALICGGGIDSNQAWQTVFGLAIALVCVGELYVEVTRIDSLPDRDKQHLRNKSDRRSSLK